MSKKLTVMQERLAARHGKVTAKHKAALEQSKLFAAQMKKVAKECMDAGFYVEQIEEDGAKGIVLGVVPNEVRDNTGPNADDLSIIRAVPISSQGRHKGQWFETDCQFEVTPAPSIRRMVERERTPFEDPPYDDEPPEMVPEEPWEAYLRAEHYKGNFVIAYEIRGVLERIADRFIDLRFPELRLDKAAD